MWTLSCGGYDRTVVVSFGVRVIKRKAISAEIAKSITKSLVVAMEEQGLDSPAIIAGLKHFATKWWLLGARAAWDTAYTLGGGRHVVVAKSMLDVIADSVLEVFDSADEGGDEKN